MNGPLDIGRIVRVRVRDMKGDVVERAGVVTRKWSDDVGNVQVFADQGDFLGNAPVFITSCTHGWGERQWHWHDETEPAELADVEEVPPETAEVTS